MKNSILRPSKLRRRRRKIFALKVSGSFLLLIGFIFLLSWLSKMSAIQIVEIKVSGNSAVEENEIKNLIEEETSKKYFRLFSKNSRFLYPNNQIEEKILSDLKEIEKTEIKSRGLKTLLVSVAERKSNAIWCADKDDSAENKNSKKINSCYFLDKEGVIFSKAPDFSGGTYVHYYGLIGTSTPIGKTYFSSVKFKEINSFLNSLKDLGVTISEFHADTENDYEIYLEDGSRIIFDNKQSFEKTLANLESILGEIGIGKSLSTSSSVKLDYADLRFGNKVFYKTK